MTEPFSETMVNRRGANQIEKIQGQEESQKRKRNVLSYIQWKSNCEDDAEDEHSGQPSEVQGTPACPVHQGYGYQGHTHHDATHTQGGVLRGVLVQAHFSEEICGVIKYLEKREGINRL